MSNANPDSIDKRLTRVRATAATLGVDLETNRPGDRTRRFTFTMPWGPTFVAIGIQQAEIFITGLRYGKDLVRYGETVVT